MDNYLFEFRSLVNDGNLVITENVEIESVEH